VKIEPLVFVCTSDVAGKLRGKAIPAAALSNGGEAQVGWTPTNVQITCLDSIAASPYGALGDLLLIGDPAARAQVDFGDEGPVEDVMLGDVRHLDGSAWECCTRTILREALERLQRVAGVSVLGAFEHEFHLPDRDAARGEGYALAAFRSERAFCEALVAALAACGIDPETVMKEYGPNQYEITVKPVSGLAIADQAALLRETVRAVGERCARRVSFAPLIEPDGIGNGVHIHLSFRDAADGRPMTYDPAGPHGMSKLTGAFIAGVLKHLPAIVGFLAPSVVSYRRLVPHRWSAAFNNLGAQDREAAIRLCPVRSFAGDDPAPRFNFEIRACDAAASPHLALAAVVHAGASGVEEGLAPPQVTEEDLSLLSPSELAARGFRRLPGTLSEALDELDASQTVRGWFPGRFVDIYLAHKRHEAAELMDLDEAALCAAYQEAY
jgi:glutamine synthetase